MIRPGLNQCSASFEQVRSRAGGLDLALGGTRPTRFPYLAMLARLPAPFAG